MATACVRPGDACGAAAACRSHYARIRAAGAPISAPLAAGRFFAVWLSYLTLFIGFIIAGFDSQKRALEDHICETRVIYSR